MRLSTSVILSVASISALVSAHDLHQRAHHQHVARQAQMAVSVASSISYSSSSSSSSAAATVAATSSAPASSAAPPISVSLASTNPTAIPLSAIVSGASSQATHALDTTVAAAAQPTWASNAPPLPNAALLVPSNYPALDKPPPTDSPQVQQWIQEVQNSGVVIPNITPTVAGGCPANPQAVADDANRCWWTCGGCTRDSDVTTCPNKLTWGLSYDDGPAPYTPDLLAYLDSQSLQSTFFVVGSRAISYPATLQAQYMGGHQIAVHTWSHPTLTTLTNEEIIAELGWSKKVIKDVLGVTPNMMRPPFGDIDDRVRAICEAMGLTPVIWTRISPQATFDTDDFNINGGVTTVGQVLQNWNNIMGNVTTLNTGFITLEHDLFQQAVDVATGYILPDALAHNPPFEIQPVITCLNKPMSDAYVELNDNTTNPVDGPVTMSSGAPGSAQATGDAKIGDSSGAVAVSAYNLFFVTLTLLAGAGVSCSEFCSPNRLPHLGSG